MRKAHLAHAIKEVCAQPLQCLQWLRLKHTEGQPDNLQWP